MFRSKTQSIIVPQYEHGKLAGTLASHWGNTDFDRPDIDFAAFVKGVTLHDWSYGVLDNLPIMESTDAEWLPFMRRGIEYSFPHPVTDIVVKLHIRRLLAGQPTPGGQLTPQRAQLVGVIDEIVDRRLVESGYSLADFQWADHITRLCDFISFDFAFGESVERTLPLCPRLKSAFEVEISYSIGAHGDISLTPWPFDDPAFTGILIGYQRQGYPTDLHPILLPYSVAER